MAETSTPTQRLAEVVLGEPLAGYLSNKREARPRWPWRLIAEQLETDTDGKIKVSAEILRVWYADELVAKSNAAHTVEKAS